MGEFSYNSRKKAWLTRCRDITVSHVVQLTANQNISVRKLTIKLISISKI